MLLRTVVYHANDQACLSAEPINNVSIVGFELVSIEGFELRVSSMDGLRIRLTVSPVQPQNNTSFLRKYELLTRNSLKPSR